MIDPDKMIRWQGRARAIIPFIAAALAILDLADGQKAEALFYTVLAVAAVWQWKAGLRHTNKLNSSADRQRYLSRVIGFELWMVFSVGIGVFAIVDGRTILGIIILGCSVPLVALLARGILTRQRASEASREDERPNRPIG
jgi:hypothetical protein